MIHNIEEKPINFFVFNLIRSFEIVNLFQITFEYEKW